MSKPEESAKESQPTDSNVFVPDLVFLKRVVVLLVLACMVISVCLNVYVMWENRALKGTVGAMQQQMSGYVQLGRLTQTLVLDLEALGRTNEGAANLLAKHSSALTMLGFAGLAHPAPEQ